MSKLVAARVGAALVGLALPVALVTSVAAQAPSAEDVGAVAGACVIDLGLGISDCSNAIEGAIVDIVVDDVNAGLAEDGIPYVVESGLGAPDLTATVVGTVPGVPVAVIPNPPVPGIVYE